MFPVPRPVYRLYECSEPLNAANYLIDADQVISRFKRILVSKDYLLYFSRRRHKGLVISLYCNGLNPHGENMHVWLH